MVVGIGEILTFIRKCTIVVGLLFAVIFFTLIMVPSQADDDNSINKVSKQIAVDAVNPEATTGAYHDTYFNKVDINHQFIVEDVNIGGGADYTSTQSTYEVNIMLEGHLGGLIEACAVSGNYAFIGKGQDFVVLDISNPASPSVLGKLITSGFVNDISVFGNYAYIVNNNGQLVIVDISNPADPTLVGHYDTPVYPEIGRIPALGVIVSNNYAYIANDLNGLVIVNISNPATPTFTGQFDAYDAEDVTVSDDYAYIAAKYDGLVIVDISNPANPTFTELYDTMGSVRSLTLSGSNVYLSNQPIVPNNLNGLLIINISNPTTPILVGKYYDTKCRDVKVSGNHAYMTNNTGLVIVNVSNTTEPIFEGFHNIAYGFVYNVAVSGNHAYITNVIGLVIVNVSNPSQPALVGHYDSEGDALGVTISGNDIYVAGLYSGLLIADINNPVMPMHVGNCDIAAEHGFRRGVALSDTYAYVANYDMGLVIVNISNPTNPTITGSYDTVGYAQDVVISGNHAYIAATSNGLLIVNISNPTEPTLIGYNDTISAEDVALSGNYAYIADYLNGILIFNISNPAEPILIESYDIDGTTRSITVSGDYAYVINSTGLVIVNVSDPTAPVFEGFYNIVIAYDVVVSGKYAYVVNYIGLVIVDISNPTEPTTAGYYNSAGNAKGVAVAGQHAYIADSSNGLVILQMAPFSSGGGGGGGSGGFISNLILNPGFEYLTQDQPDNWTLSGTASVTDTLSSEGNNSLNINASISGDILFANQTLDTYHVAGKSYTFTFDIARSGGISGDAISFYLNYIDFNATEQSLYVWTPNPNDDSNFWMYQHEQIIPSDAFNITGFEMHTNGTGEYWIDNLSLVIEQTPPSLDLYQNYTLEVINIDNSGLEVWLEFDKNGNPVKDIVIQNLSTYEYRNASTNDLIINCTVSYVKFLNNNRSWVVLLEDIWQFSDVDGSVLINGTYNTFFGGEQYHDANVLPSGSAVLDIYESTGDVFSFDIGEVENDFIMVEGDCALQFDQTLNISGNLVDMGAVPIDTVTAAPGAGYVNGSVSPVLGHTYCVNISGKYAKFEVVDVTTKNIRIRWSYQPSGSNNFGSFITPPLLSKAQVHVNLEYEAYTEDDSFTSGTFTVDRYIGVNVENLDDLTDLKVTSPINVTISAPVIWQFDNDRGYLIDNTSNIGNWSYPYEIPEGWEEYIAQVQLQGATSTFEFDLDRTIENDGIVTADGIHTVNFTITYYNLTEISWTPLQFELYNTSFANSWFVLGGLNTDAPINSVEYESDYIWLEPNTAALNAGQTYNISVQYYVDIMNGPVILKPGVWMDMELGEYKPSEFSNNGTSIAMNDTYMPEITYITVNSTENLSWYRFSHLHHSLIMETIVESYGPRAEFGVGKMVTTATDDDVLLSGDFTGFNRYCFNIHNIEDSSGTELSDIEFEVNANNINENDIWWREYSSLDGSLLSWTFPSEFVIGEDEGFGVGYDTSESEVGFLNMDISRSFNETNFNSDGYQLAQFNVTFEDKKFNWTWGSIDVWEDFEIKPTILSAYASDPDVLNDFWVDENNVHFNFDYEKIEIDTTYTFTALIYVDLNDNLAPPMRYKPRFEVTVNKDHDQINGGQYQTANMPDSMLFDSINAASATTDISNIWTFSNYSEVSGILEQEIELMGPRADFVFEKNFIVGSDSDSLLNGEYTENLWYTLYMENFGDETDTVMGDLEFNATTSNAIQHVDWEEYADWDSSYVDWYFPSPDFVLYDYDQLFTGFSTDYSESKSFNMDMSRSFNKTEFNSDGYQKGTFKVTFKEKNMQWIWGNIEVFDFADVNVSLIPGSLWIDAPLNDYWIDSKIFEFSINPEDVELNKEYTFTVITEINIPTAIEGAGINFTYKPDFNVGLNNGETFNNSGASYSTSMPSDMLFDHVTSASASSNISNIWTLISRNQVIGVLDQINNIDSIRVENFYITPADPISVINPAHISAKVTGINLYDVGFVVIEPESGTVPIIGFMDNIGGDQYEDSWDGQIFYITNGTTTMEPLVLIFPNGKFVQDEEAYGVMGDLKINDSTNYQYVVALFNDTQLIDIWDDQDNSIFDQIEYDMTVFNPYYVTSLSNGPQTFEDGLIINNDFKIFGKSAQNIYFNITIIAKDDYHGDGEFNSNEITIIVDNTPPEVNITEPANLEIDVDIDTNITATFNESMNNSTLNNSTVKVYIQEKIAGETFENTVGTWNSTNFQGFIYIEQLKILPQPIDDSSRTIGEGNITYSTQPLPKDYLIYTYEDKKVEGSGNYNIIGWLGDEYVVIDNGTGDWIISILVFEQSSIDIKTLHSGETWNLGDGYSLEVLDISKSDPKAFVALYNSSGKIYDVTCVNQSPCIFTEDLGASDNSPIFVTYMNKVNTTHIELKYTWLISQDTTAILNNDEFSDFKVKTSNDKIILENDEDVILSKGDIIQLFDDFKFEVEDTANVTCRLIRQTEIAVEGDISYNSSSNTVTFDPVSNLNENTDYFPRITTGAEDLAGNGLTEDYIWTFKTVDATPPKITIDDVTSPTNFDYKIVTGKVESGAEVEVTCPTATVGTVTYPTGTTWSVEITDMTEGDNVITARATDQAGNKASDTKTIVVDLTAPELTLELDTEGNDNTLYIYSSENLSSCTVRFPNDTTHQCTKMITPSNWSSPSLTQNGSYVINGTDKAGNVALRNLTLEIGTINATDHNQTNYTTGNVTLDITTTHSVNDSNITICEYDENPVGSLNATTVSLLGINKFVQIEVDPELNDSIGTVRISINYSDADLSEIDEDSLKLYVWNASIKSWEELEPSGINKVKTIVWGELNHFSFFGILGEEPEDVQDDDDNGGSSSGGSGGGASGELYENIACSETDRQHVYTNSDISYSFELECNIVQFVKFTSLKSAGQVATKVEILKDTSTLVDNPPSDIVYKNLNIWVGNAGWATERNIDDATVVFTVDKSWITENNIDESSIALYRYSDDSWNKLVTWEISGDANSLQFEAETPGFSPFAVTGKELEGEPGGEGIIPEPTVTAEKTPTSTEKKGIPGFSLFAGLSILLIAVQILRKKN
jgi:S-layer protein (TIGR01567 family)